MTMILCELTECVHNGFDKNSKGNSGICKCTALGVKKIGITQLSISVCDSYLKLPDEIQNKIKIKCNKCNDTGKIEYYHDAGDHFSAGPAPGSGWRTKPCKCQRNK